MPAEQLLYERIAAAYVRGRLASTIRDHGAPRGEDLDSSQFIDLGRAAGLRLHRFKRTMGLARVERVLGILAGLAPEKLLDIGSGRGAFLWPLVDRFPDLPVTAVDRLSHRAADLGCVARGGISTLQVVRGDVTRLPFDKGAFDVATLLEVLEHVPDTAAALAELRRVTRRFLVVSVPSQPDENPEHIHLFSSTALTRELEQAGAKRVRVQSVLNHLIAVASLS